MPACGLRAVASAMQWSFRDPLGGCPHLSKALSVDSSAVCRGGVARSRSGPAGSGRPRDLRQGPRGEGSRLHEGRGLRRSRGTARHATSDLVAPLREHGQRASLAHRFPHASRCARTPAARRGGRGDQLARRRAWPNQTLHPTAATRPLGQAGGAPFWPRRVSAKPFGWSRRAFVMFLRRG